MMKRTIAAALAIAGLSGLVFAEVDAQRGEELSQTCAGCHGTDGNSSDPANPSLAGQNERYFVEQLQAYQSGQRVNALMQGFAADLSEQDMRDLAAFYAEQEPTFGEADPDLVELGRQIYRAGIEESGVMSCMACHGAQGQGNAPAGFPRVAGQHADYTIRQLEAYRAGHRADEPSENARMTDGQTRKMRAVAYRMRDHEIEAVASYLQGLH
ncbi:MAG: cytochrome c4 [Natronospirillum sp.]|uniref:c-type cytochrome n=1 Tax=Natronospirillum sp. TaxID=2812955 RepID=UPI0025D336BD|nr:c-type cytochrome [Natronospirillum sp.]MCH8551721.1 cytochrome c4 [Natronospirillum sp.]